MAIVDNLSELTIAQLIPIMRICIQAQHPFFLWAGPGIGKSSVVGQVAKSLGGIAIDLRMGQLQPQDILGMPMPGKDADGNAVMHWAPPELLPSKEFASKFPVVVLFLDEMNSAPPAVQGAAYQLVNDRRAGTYELPDNVVIVAAGNREGDRGVTHRLAHPLANRFSHFGVRHDYDSWLDWAITAKINTDVVAFVSQFNGKLYQFDPTSADKAFATPRSWEFTSKLLNMAAATGNTSESVIRTLVAGTVGTGMAGEFMRFLKVGKNLPKPSEILSGKVTELKIREIDAHYQIIMSLLYELNEFLQNNSTPTGELVQRKQGGQVEKRRFNTEARAQEFRDQFNNYLRFLLQFDLEIGIMGARLACSNYAFPVHSPLQKLKSFVEVTAKYGKYLV